MPQQWIEFLWGQWNEHGMAWISFFAILVGAWALSWLARWVMGRVVHTLVSKTDSTLDDRIIAATANPLRLVVFMLGLNMALSSLQVRISAFQGEPGTATAGRFAAEFGAINHVVDALIILVVTRFALGFFRAILDWYVHKKAVGNQATWDDQLIPLIRRVASLVMYFIAVSIMLESFGYEITALVTTAGVASLAVALAAQETLSNMLGGFVILVDRPFRVGDVIELTDGKVGEVVEIGLRSTRISQFDGNAMVIPNKDMANSRITNFALPTPRAAIRSTIGVDYGTDIEKVKGVLLDILNNHPELLKDPAPGVWFTKFNESSLDLFFSCWVESYRDRFRVADDLNMQVLKAFRENGISIPFPQRDVHLFVKESQKAQVGALVSERRPNSEDAPRAESPAEKPA
jgi:MscS family membrane protein